MEDVDMMEVESADPAMSKVDAPSTRSLHMAEPWLEVLTHTQKCHIHTHLWG